MGAVTESARLGGETEGAEIWKLCFPAGFDGEPCDAFEDGFELNG